MSIEQVIVRVSLTLFLFEFLVEFALNEMNLLYVRKHAAAGGIPKAFDGWLSGADYQRSVEYTLAKGKFQRSASIYEIILTLWVVFGGALPMLNRIAETLGARFPAGMRATGILFCLGAGLILSLFQLPTGIYSTFVLEERFGFNKTTPGLYVADRVKAFLLALVIGGPFLFAVLWLMDVAGSYWWLWVFFLVLGFQLCMVVIYPTLIAPVFNKFEPLREGELHQRIVDMAGKVGFKASGIFTMDGSRRSAHSNAYFTGLGKSKRIVLFDTLVEQMSVEEGVAVLGHEMGHYKMKHIRRMLVLRSIYLLAGLYVLSFMLGYEPFFHAFGFDRPTDHAALVLFSLLAGPATFYLQPFFNYISRRHEYEADRFAAQVLKDGKPMEQALVKLTVRNLSNLTPHPWYSGYHYCHPTPGERISAIRQEG